jgi:hypothetical protein
VSVAHILQRPLPAQHLIPGLDVDLGVKLIGSQALVGVEVAAIDVDVHAVDRVDRLLEAREVDVYDVIDVDPGELMHHLEGLRWAADRVRVVELADAVAGDVDLQIPRQ